MVLAGSSWSHAWPCGRWEGELALSEHHERLQTLTSGSTGDLISTTCLSTRAKSHCENCNTHCIECFAKCARTRFVENSPQV